MSTASPSSRQTRKGNDIYQDGKKIAYIKNGKIFKPDGRYIRDLPEPKKELPMPTPQPRPRSFFRKPLVIGSTIATGLIVVSTTILAVVASSKPNESKTTTPIAVDNSEPKAAANDNDVAATPIAVIQKETPKKAVANDIPSQQFQIIITGATMCVKGRAQNGEKFVVMMRSTHDPEHWDNIGYLDFDSTRTGVWEPRSTVVAGATVKIEDDNTGRLICQATRPHAPPRHVSKFEAMENASYQQKKSPSSK